MTEMQKISIFGKMSNYMATMKHVWGGGSCGHRESGRCWFCLGWL